MSSKEIKVLIYETSTGEIKSDCTLCGTYVFPDEESRNYHMHRANIPNRASIELTDQEFDEIPGEFDAVNNSYKCKVCTKTARYRLSERQKEEYEKHEYGITFKDKRPAKALIRKKIGRRRI